MRQFDLMALASIALLALAILEAYRNYTGKGLLLSLLLLALSLLQVLWVLRFTPPWGKLDVETWTVITAGMICCTSLGLLNLDLRGYTESAAILIVLVALLQLLLGSGIIKLAL
jgi:hypothetical protein